MNLVRLRDGSPQWPYTLATLRVDEPRLSLSQRPHAAELAALSTLDPPVLVFEVQPTEAPPFDPGTQRLVQAMPELVNGQWLQRWDIEDLPPPPEPEPEPDWVSFGAALAFDQPMKDFVLAVAAAEPVLDRMLTVGLGQAGQGDPQTFSAAWAAARAVGLVSVELIEHMQELAAQHHLPAAFIEGLAS